MTPVTTRPHLGVVDLLACLLALGRPNCPALDGLLLLLFDVDNLSTHISFFSFFSSIFKIYSSLSGMSRLELDSPGFGSGVQAGCHLLPAGPGLGVGGEPPAPVGGIAGGLQGLDSLV